MDKELIELIKIQQKFNDEFKLECKERISKVEDSIERIENNHLKHIENDMIAIKNSNMWLTRIGTGIIFVLVGLFLKAIFGGL